MARNKMIVAGLLACLAWTFAALPGAQVWAQDGGDTPVNLILKNDSGSSVDVALIDQYGGNFTATIDGGTSQNQTLKAQSEIKIGESTVHVVSPSDEGLEIIIASP